MAITIGSKAEQTVLVTSEIAITFLELEAARVLSTPEMIRLMEQTCRRLVLPQLDPGHDTVGTHVNVYHLAGAPIGTPVRFTAEITGVEGRRVQFKVEAASETEKIGEGTHERGIINIAKFAARLAQKLEKK
ncbi:MAG: thioesterase family protein [Candidatus Solibacter sp.]